MEPWQCQLCSATYISLYELVSHVRAVHSAEKHLNLVCKVDDCTRVFKNTNTWYRHLIKNHHKAYMSNDREDDRSCNPEDDLLSSQDDSSSDQEDGTDDMNGVSENEHTDLSAEVSELPQGEGVPSLAIGPLHQVPGSITKEVAAGTLIKLKVKHLLTNSAINDVVELVGVVCDSVITNTLSALSLEVEACGMDTTSTFFQRLPEILEHHSNPLATIGTTYRQQSFISKNLPYVVCS